jgi:hypothetical protein
MAYPFDEKEPFSRLPPPVFVKPGPENGRECNLYRKAIEPLSKIKEHPSTGSGRTVATLKSL